MPLHVYQSLWGMERLPWRGGAPWTLDEQLDRIVAAGFDGVSMGFRELAGARRIAAAAAGRGLRIQVGCIPASVEALAPVLAAIEDIREHVDHVNIQPHVRPDSVRESVAHLLGWQALAEQAGVPLYVETHRDRMTQDLRFTLQLLDAVPTLQLTADLSHYVVGGEFPLPPTDADRARIDRILRRTGAFHARVASSGQIQVPSGFPQHRPWLELFADWWREGFRLFQESAGPDEILTFTAELGPPGWYAITGPDGEELSDRWAEALELAALARTLWREAESQAIR